MNAVGIRLETNLMLLCYMKVSVYQSNMFRDHGSHFFVKYICVYVIGIHMDVI